MKTLANTTVLSNLAAVDRLDLLKQLFGRLQMPNEVYQEILDGLEEGYGFYLGIEKQIHPLAEDGWIELVSMAGDEELRTFQSLPRRLHHGEAACLAIARHRGWFFLSDDKLARKLAESFGILVSGTLGVLVQSKAGQHNTRRRRRAASADDRPRIPISMCQLAASTSSA